MSEAPPPVAAPSRRGTETRQRTRHVDVRCTEDELATIAAAAERAGMTVGAFMRHQAIGTPSPRAARRPTRQKVEMAQTLGLLGRVGGNVNQLAKAFNTDGSQPSVADWLEVKTLLTSMHDALMQALGRPA